MIHLFLSGRSALKDLNKKVNGLKAGINFAFLFCDDLDILIWGDKIVGDKIFQTYKEKPKFKLVCLEKNEGLAKEWVDETFAYDYGVFTAVWSLLWLRKKYPDEEICVYGLDGDGIDYYDGAVEIEQPKIEERIRRNNICYYQLDNLPISKEKIYNCNPESSYKGFSFYEHRI